MSVSTIWGTKARERVAPYPCDRYVAQPDAVYYRGVTVAAPADVLFRWLCQLRIAPYSYDWLDNGGRPSPQRLIPNIDKLAVGQQVMTIFTLVEFATNQHITLKLKSRAEWVFGELTVSYMVVPLGAAQCRLLTKLVIRYPQGWYGRILRAVLPWGDLLMMRRQLLNFKRLAEEHQESEG